MTGLARSQAGERIASAIERASTGTLCEIAADLDTVVSGDRSDLAQGLAAAVPAWSRSPSPELEQSSECCRTPSSWLAGSDEHLAVEFREFSSRVQRDGCRYRSSWLLTL